MTAHPGQIHTAAIFDHPDFDGHEQVVFCNDKVSGLKAIIAIHDTTCGPALGGTRMWNYASAGEGLTDALRLSRGMTYKNVLAGLDLGGGKAVIFGDSRTEKTEDKIRAYARFVESLGGKYITAEDVGITSADAEIMATESKHVAGTEQRGCGDPSPYTALGTFAGLKAAARHVFGTDNLTGKTVSVQGLGNVGFRLAQFLHDAGAKLIVSDVYQPSVDKAVARFAATVVDPNLAHAVECDIYAPCALGATINPQTISDIRAKVVAGAANNQLASAAEGKDLQKRGILYTPDYVINAGGVISVAMSRINGSDAHVLEKVNAIADTLTNIFQRAEIEKTCTSAISDAMALEMLAARRKK